MDRRQPPGGGQALRQGDDVVSAADLVGSVVGSVLLAGLAALLYLTQPEPVAPPAPPEPAPLYEVRNV